MSLSELISGVLEPVFDLLPRFGRRPTTNEFGLRDSWFFGVKVFKGPLLHIPIMTQVEYYSRVQYPLDTGLQSLTTVCGKSVTVNATAIITVTDPIVLRNTVDVDEWEPLVSMKIRSVVREVVSEYNWSHLMEAAREILESELWGELEILGIELNQVVLEDATEAFPVRLLSPPIGA